METLTLYLRLAAVVSLAGSAAEVPAGNAFEGLVGIAIEGLVVADNAIEAPA